MRNTQNTPENAKEPFKKVIQQLPWTPETRINYLIRKFPDFFKCVPSYIVNPFDAPAFDNWAAKTPISETELIISQFILMVCDPGHKWNAGRFYIADAIKKLSDESLDVIKDWVQNHFFL